MEDIYGSTIIDFAISLKLFYKALFISQLCFDAESSPESECT